MSVNASPPSSSSRGATWATGEQRLHAQRDASNKECSHHRPNQLSLSSGPRRIAVNKNSSNGNKRGAICTSSATTMVGAGDARQASQQPLVQQQSDRRGLGNCRRAPVEMLGSLGPCSAVSHHIATAMACSSSSSTSCSDDGSMEGNSHHEESGFVSAASSVCLDDDTPITPAIQPPPSHKPKASALNLPGCEELPLHDDLAAASAAEPADIEVVVLADYQPCCGVELKVFQGQYANALFQTGAWLYVRLVSRNASGSREGYVPSEFCNLALLSPGTLDELSNDFDTLGDPFSPPRQLTVFNSLTTPSHLSSDSAHAVRYDVAQVQQKSDRLSSVGGAADVGRPRSQTSATSQSVDSSPTHQSGNRRHSYSAQSDTEGYTTRSKHIVAELNVRTRKAPGRTRVTAEHRPHSSYQSNKVQSDYETWTRVPPAKGRSTFDSSTKGQHSKYESDAEFVPSDRKRSNTMADIAPTTRTSRSKLVQRLRNFRSKGSTLKHTSLDDFSPAVSEQLSPEHNAFEGRRSHVATSREMASAPSKASNGYTSDTEILAPKLSKSSKRRSLFSSLRRLNGGGGGGSQTDTEDGAQSHRRRWTSLHLSKKERARVDAQQQRVTYDEPPMRRQSSLPRLWSSSSAHQKQQQATHASTSSRSGEQVRSLQRLTMVYVPSVAACNFSGKQQLGQVSLKEGQRVFRIVPANDGSNGGKAKKSTAASGWVMVMDPWTKREGLVPQSCLSSMPTLSQSTVL